LPKQLSIAGSQYAEYYSSSAKFTRNSAYYLQLVSKTRSPHGINPSATDLTAHGKAFRRTDIYTHTDGDKDESADLNRDRQQRR
jgi:hypothetical protein